MISENIADIKLGEVNRRQSVLRYPEMVALKIAVKLDPIQIGLYYKCTPKDKKKRLYVVDLQSLLMLCEAQRITEVLFEQHSQFFNKEKVSFVQVLNIIDKILEFIQKEIMNDDEIMTGEEIDLNYM